MKISESEEVNDGRTSVEYMRPGVVCHMSWREGLINQVGLEQVTELSFMKSLMKWDSVVSKKCKN